MDSRLTTNLLILRGVVLAEFDRDHPIARTASYACAAAQIERAQMYPDFRWRVKLLAVDMPILLGASTGTFIIGTVGIKKRGLVLCKNS
jgi:hypothetical protein